MSHTHARARTGRHPLCVFAWQQVLTDLTRDDFHERVVVVLQLPPLRNIRKGDKQKKTATHSLLQQYAIKHQHTHSDNSTRGTNRQSSRTNKSSRLTVYVSVIPCRHLPHRLLPGPPSKVPVSSPRQACLPPPEPTPRPSLATSGLLPQTPWPPGQGPWPRPQREPPL